jgi:dual specificity tyrosine-phosphorylation-regulated kinase 2/3/4
VRNPGDKDLNEVMKCEDELFVDFVNRWIEWKVEDRLTPETAQDHPWIQEGIREMRENKKRSGKETRASTCHSK